ncbi:MAG: enoyl-CoA hydratase/isomerase family protein [Proteobacteria bacterium]|nr:enoyl-CoA hydratase/isomerase family protein [Pseudomonadota bacterium]
MNEEILFEETPGKNGNIGFITLNRPKALNALTYEMILALTQQLLIWEKLPHIKAIVIQSNNEKAFCAGGDLRKVYEIGKAGNLSILEFFRDEYRLNHLIFHYSKPYISLLNGITMGGGAGISLHGSHPIATEKLMFAMPETGIGFFPDIGGSYFLSRCQGKLGTYFGLTGTRLNLEDAVYAGLISHHLPSDSLNAFLNTLVETSLGDSPKEKVSQIIQSFSKPLRESSFIQYRPLIDDCFSGKTIETIISNLEKHNDSWCKKTIELLKTKSPTSLKITLQQIQQGTAFHFDDCMKMEYRLASHFLRSQDFYEGIRAVLIDKDQKPHWQPNDLSAITETQVNQYFTSLGTKELTFE